MDIKPEYYNAIQGIDGYEMKKINEIINDCDIKIQENKVYLKGTEVIEQLLIRKVYRMLPK